MPFFKNQLSHFFDRIIEKRRLSESLVLTGDELTFKALGHVVGSQSESEQCLQQLYKEIALQLSFDWQRQQALQYYQLGVLLEIDQFEASLRYFNGSDLDKELLLQRCWRMIWADRHLGLREYQVVHLFGYWLGWEREAIERLGLAYRPIYISQQHQQALILLGVEVDSPKQFIKQQYKRQLARYHPDKIVGAGGCDEDIDKATMMTVKIHEAYTLIRKLHH